MNKKLHGKSRVRIAFASAIVILFILIIPALIIERSSQKELDALKAKRIELSSLNSEYETLKTRVDVIERKSTLAQVSGVANAVDSTVSSLGIKEKIKSIKAVGNREMKSSMVEESAEIRIDRVSMNEMVNIFSKIEDAPMILSVKRVAIKKSFENPELLDITMTVALFTRK